MDIEEIKVFIRAQKKKNIPVFRVIFQALHWIEHLLVYKIEIRELKKSLKVKLFLANSECEIRPGDILAIEELSGKELLDVIEQKNQRIKYLRCAAKRAKALL